MSQTIVVGGSAEKNLLIWGDGRECDKRRLGLRGNWHCFR